MATSQDAAGIDRAGDFATYSASISPKTSTLAEDVDKELTCAICLSRYETPKVLPCLHTYCKSCLDDLLTKSREPDRVICPQCKEEHQLPEDGVEGFRTYFTINNLLEVLQVGLLISATCGLEPKAARCAPVLTLQAVLNMVGGVGFTNTMFHAPHAYSTKHTYMYMGCHCVKTPDFSNICETHVFC